METASTLVDSFLSDDVPELRPRVFDNIRSLYYCQTPVYVPSFNNPTYVVKMLRQLFRYRFNNITIVDSGSNYSKMKDVLGKLDSDCVCNVVRLSRNMGPRHIVKSCEFYDSLPELFCLTDPDIAFNENLPVDFMRQLTDLTDYFKIGKAGFALSLKHRSRMKHDKYLNSKQMGPTHIWEWESQFWRYKLGRLPDGSEVFDAPIDTTFALYNKKYFKPDRFFDAVRVSGNFESEHTPWYQGSVLPAEEERVYQRTGKFSNYRPASVQV